MKQKGSSQQTAVLFMLLLLVAALAVVAAPRLGQMFGPWVAPGLPENAAVDAAPAAAESFDYEQAADNFAARWVAIGQGYERLGRLNEHHVPPSQSLPTAIVLSMAESLSAGDLDKLMTYWADDATFYIFGLPPNGSELVQGQAALRAEFTDEIANHQQLEVEIDTVRGDIIMTREKTWHDFTRQIGVAPLEATGVYQIMDGQIANYAWTLTEASVDKIQAALAGMPAEAAPPPTVVELPVSAFTVTFADGTCHYDGPLALQAGDLQVTVDVQDLDKARYAFSLFTLDEGKDFMDLMASTVRSGPPSWSQMIFLKEARPATTATYSVTIDGGPVYAVCWSQPPDIAIGNVGPFAVVE